MYESGPLALLRPVILSLVIIELLWIHQSLSELMFSLRKRIYYFISVVGPLHWSRVNKALQITVYHKKITSDFYKCKHVAWVDMAYTVPAHNKKTNAALSCREAQALINVDNEHSQTAALLCSGLAALTK